MATAVEKSIYPFATPEGQAVPLDVVKPVSLFFIVLAAGNNDFTLPETFENCFIYSSVDCIFRAGASMPASLATETEYSDAVFIPQHFVMTLNLEPGTASIWAAGAGGIYISAVQQWQLLRSNYQLNVG